jgi:hypothetical protein
MKYVMTLLLLIAVAAIGFTGFRLFQTSQYDLSNLFVATSYAGIVATIYMLTVYRRQQRIG